MSKNFSGDLLCVYAGVHSAVYDVCGHAGHKIQQRKLRSFSENPISCHFKWKCHHPLLLRPLRECENISCTSRSHCWAREREKHAERAYGAVAFYCAFYLCPSCEAGKFSCIPTKTDNKKYHIHHCKWLFLEPSCLLLKYLEYVRWLKADK